MTDTERDDLPAGDGPEYASFWLRVGAYLLDSLIIGVPMYLLILVLQKAGLLPNPTAGLSQTDPAYLAAAAEEALFSTAFGLVATIAYRAYFEAQGATPGKRALRLRTVQLGTDAPPTMQTAATRALIWNAASPVYLVAYLTMNPVTAMYLFYGLAVLWLLGVVIPFAYSDVKQALHDKLTYVAVIREPVRGRA